MPGKHVLPRQQPAQLFWLHWGWAWQAPPAGPTAVQNSPSVEQLVHACPLKPHCVCDVPVKQTLPPQQPVQLLGLHAGCPTQTPPVPPGTHLPPDPRQLPQT
jgi:hypothetical protein